MVETVYVPLSPSNIPLPPALPRVPEDSCSDVIGYGVFAMWFKLDGKIRNLAIYTVVLH